MNVEYDTTYWRYLSRLRLMLTLLTGNGDTVDTDSNRFTYEMHPHWNGRLVHIVVCLQLGVILREDRNGRRSQRRFLTRWSFACSVAKVFEGKVLDAVVAPVEVEDHLQLNQM